MKDLGTNENTEQTYRQDRLGNNDCRQFSQLYRDTKKEKMENWEGKRELLERGMQRVKIRLNRIQQDPLLTPTTSVTGFKPKQLIGPEYHDYHEYDHYRKQMIHEHAMYLEKNDLIKKLIRADALLSRQLQEE